MFVYFGKVHLFIDRQQNREYARQVAHKHTLGSVQVAGQEEGREGVDVTGEFHGSRRHEEVGIRMLILWPCSIDWVLFVCGLLLIWGRILSQLFIEGAQVGEWMDVRSMEVASD